MQVPRRLRRPRRGYTRQQLNDWLDEQERIIRARALPNEIVEEFDPLYNPLHQVYAPGEHGVEQGRRTILFRFKLNLESSIADQIQSKLVESVKTRFKLNLSSAAELRNIADGKKISYYQTIGDSPWLETLTAAKDWVKQQEELRLENQHRPNTQWAYEKTLIVYAKVILDRSGFQTLTASRSLRARRSCNGSTKCRCWASTLVTTISSSSASTLSRSWPKTKMSSQRRRTGASCSSTLPSSSSWM